MEITKLSTKGQVVIPEGMRRGLDVGTAFAVVRKNNMIILKRVEGITEEEQKEMKELEKIWKEIDEGRCRTYSQEEFFEAMKAW